MNVSEQSAIKQLDVESADDASFPGHILRNARKSMGLSKEELSRQLHLTPRILEAIEIDDFSTISNAIFAKYQRCGHGVSLQCLFQRFARVCLERNPGPLRIVRSKTIENYA